MNVQLDTKELDRILQNLEPKANRLVNRRGQKVASDWASQVRVDTSAFRNSILSESRMASRLLFIAQDGVTYGIFNELGTYKMSAKPDLMNAITRNEKPFMESFKELFR